MPEQPHVLYQALPSMHTILDAFANAASYGDVRLAALCSTLSAGVPRTSLRESLENFLNDCRSAIAEGRITDVDDLSLPVLLPRLAEHAARQTGPHLRRVLNATGVIIHTNLGRSLLADEAVEAVTQAARYASNLEFDLEEGIRGSRYVHVAPLICRLVGAESAIVVNNNAAAVLLVLDTLCRGREVVVSRGELVEIGGNFRIPAIMEKSGCQLKEIGATNRTHLADFREAITDNTAAFLKVHTSNFRIIGFTKEVSRTELAALAHTFGLPLIEDLGSGTLFDFLAAGFPHLRAEPTAAQVLAGGADVLTFSGDKMLGGPQSGIIAGKAEYIERIARNPLIRALRIDKLSLAALEATLRLYRDPALAAKCIPTLRRMTMSADLLRHRAGKLARLLKKVLPVQDGDWGVYLRQSTSRTGGGAFPEQDLPTWLAVITSSKAGFNPNTLRQALLHANPPLVVRVEDDAVCLDPRTLEDTEFPLVAQAVSASITL